MSGDYRPTRMRSPTPSAEHFVLTLWTDDPALARRADEAGIDRIGVDLDRLGKAGRQRGRGTWISPHREKALKLLGPELRRSALFARVDPLNPDTPRQVEEVTDCGVDVLMLPMVATAEEAERFVSIVGDRAIVVLLVERIDAVERLEELVAVDGVDEIHLGLNDLALSLGLPNRWLVLAGDLAERAGGIVRGAGLRFGLGGIGRPGDRSLPIPSDLVYAEYARTGARAALISRSFMTDAAGSLSNEVLRARRELVAWQCRPSLELAAAHDELARFARGSEAW